MQGVERIIPDYTEVDLEYSGVHKNYNDLDLAAKDLDDVRSKISKVGITSTGL